MMSDVICVMENGAIAQIGSPEDIYNHPTDVFVATFLGETNLLPCEMCGVEQGLARVRMADGMSCLARPGKAPPGAAGRTTLSLRPERLRLLAPDETADNVADAELIERVFLGQQVRYTVRVLGQTVVVVGGPADGAPVAAGERLRIGWSRDAGQILAAG
jgi:ABC-type Fe3+/spermidine/putrescine transport system ATPase subunit